MEVKKITNHKKFINQLNKNRRKEVELFIDRVLKTAKNQQNNTNFNQS